MANNDNQLNQPAFNELAVFNELFNADRVDDTICETHQASLRSQALEAFDQAQKIAIASSQSVALDHRDFSRGNRLFAVAATMLACLIAIVMLWTANSHHPLDQEIVLNMVEASIDSQLVASLAEVINFREDVSPDEFFGAIEICRSEYEYQRNAFSDAQQLDRYFQDLNL